MAETNQEWRPRHGDRVRVEGRTKGKVLLSDPDIEQALVRTDLNEERPLPWAVLEREQAA